MTLPLESHRPGFLVLQGRGAAPGTACGPLRRNRPDLDPAAAAGAILVAERARPEDVGRILAARGTLTLGGAVLSHVSLLSREFGKASVALGEWSRVRILPENEPSGVLELADVVGAGASPVLADGEIVLLDGDRGIVTVPGGADPALREEVRRAHDLLCDYARAPEDDRRLARLVDAVRGFGEPAFEYVLEAALPNRWVPPGDPARRFVAAMVRGARPPERVESRLRELLDEVLERACDELPRQADEIRAAGSVDEIERAVRRLREAAFRERGLVEDLGGDPGQVDGLVGAVLEEAAGRRQAMCLELGRQVEEASLLPDRALSHRLGGFLRLARQARAAGVGSPAVARLEARLAERAAEVRRRVGDALVVSLHAAGACDRAAVGGKAAGLLEVGPVLPEGCVVPRGFVVTTAAYRLHVLGDTGERLRKAVRERDEAAVSRKARAAILSGEVPEEVARAVVAALAELGSEQLAVRSSASVEDGPAGSLAGQFDTVLGVRGEAEVLQRVRQTWASLWNARALRSMAACGLSPLEAHQAVLVQEIVPTRCAGVMVTRDPSGRPDALLINAAWGLGEGISQGEVPGDLFWVRRSTGEILAAEAGRGATRIVLDPGDGGTSEQPLDPAQSGRLSLSEEQIGRLAELARALEEATGRAQDVEFGFTDDDALVIFQVRRLLAARKV